MTLEQAQLYFSQAVAALAIVLIVIPAITGAIVGG